jgi:hypothetical protein
MVKDIVTDLDLPVTVRHLAYTGIEAREFATALDLTPGTAKEVAGRLGIDVDWQAVYDLIDRSGRKGPDAKDTGCCPTAAAKWTPDLDKALLPCEERALDAGIMMTPVLVINGEKVHQGSVPDPDRTRSWIEAAFPRVEDRPTADTIIEVLGPGCDKCDTLYDNVLAAIASLGEAEGISVKKRKDIRYFHRLGVGVTPGLVINGQVVSTGRVLTPEQIAAHLETQVAR